MITIDKVTGLVAGCILATSVIIAGLGPHPFEEIALILDRSPDKAFEYGQYHFNSAHSSAYDLRRAEELFTRVYMRDENYPLVRHELSRISFLKGDLDRAVYLATQELELNPNPSPSTYYIRALTYGYLRRYTDAANDYEKYFSLVPANWGSINDYAWVLLKVGYAEAALEALEWGLGQWPKNAWLLHNKVIALYELGRYKDAVETGELALKAVETVTEEEWLLAYPGNDPRVAHEGLTTFRNAVLENVHMSSRKLIQ